MHFRCLLTRDAEAETDVRIDCDYSTFRSRTMAAEFCGQVSFTKMYNQRRGNRANLASGRRGEPGQLADELFDLLHYVLSKDRSTTMLAYRLVPLFGERYRRPTLRALHRLD